MEVSFSLSSAARAGENQPRIPVLLCEDARKRFINLYETRINEQIYYPPAGETTTYRRIFELQAYQMARWILGEIAEYQPLLVR